MSSISNWLRLQLHTLDKIDHIFIEAKDFVLSQVQEAGKISGQKLDQHQHIAHSLAWLATYRESLKQLQTYAENLIDKKAFTDVEFLITKIGFAEYTAQIFTAIPMNQTEFCRLSDFNIDPQTYLTSDIKELIAIGTQPQLKMELISCIKNSSFISMIGQSSLDETMEEIRDEIRKFCEAEITPYAHIWHKNNDYIPIDIINQLTALGVFGLTVPEDFGGMGLGKIALCAVTEELSRAYIGVGSLGTRAEIAAELILCGGTEAQKQHYLPLISSGELLTTAVFTEPNTGSDLAALKTRATKNNDHYIIHGNKTWITHAVRTDMMTLLARTDPSESGYRGLSMFLIEKPRGSDDHPFPLEGMSGTEIEVLGYRGMKEYEIAFDNVKIPASSLLGEIEGNGFKQLMQTFESARIQTAARAVGVAQSAFDHAFRYAGDRVQFNQPIINFPRVAHKLALMIAEIHIARQLTYFSAHQKDDDKRCDLEAGMAKLLAARIAWSCADNAVQIHGGNGFALEYEISRILCDARILNIFEGAAEIQAHVMCRRLLE
jgi:(2S)-methylsuccinyl-CoA dehydrogenase